MSERARKDLRTRVEEESNVAHDSGQIFRVGHNKGENKSLSQKHASIILQLNSRLKYPKRKYTC